eukprot:Hpha_TRINITY_DN14362_c0_g1::TRINITY_DN14362_c0_g1_i1::g.86461::m.86461
MRGSGTLDARMTHSNSHNPWNTQPPADSVGVGGAASPWYQQKSRSDAVGGETLAGRQGPGWSSPVQQGPAVPNATHNAAFRDADDRWEAALARLNALREETHRRRMEYEERHRQQRAMQQTSRTPPKTRPQGQWSTVGPQYGQAGADHRRTAATPPPGARSESPWKGRSTPTSAAVTTPSTLTPSDPSPGYSSPRAQAGSRYDGSQYDVAPVVPPTFSQLRPRAQQSTVNALRREETSDAAVDARSQQQQSWDEYWRTATQHRSGSGGNERMSRERLTNLGIGGTAARTMSSPRTSSPVQARPPLPEGWTEEVDPTSGHIFYHNHRTGVSQWIPPPTQTTPEPPALAEPSSWWRAVADPKHRSPGRAYNRTPSMDWSGPSETVISPQSAHDRGKYVIVLDLDETIVYAREGPLVIRPGAVGLIDLLVRDTETVVWTAGERDYAQQVLREIDRTSGVRHCIYRHPKWFNGNPGQLKDLRLLGRDLSRVLVVENTPDCVRRQSENAVLVPDYYGATDDCTLPKLGELIRSLVSSGLPVHEFLRQAAHMVQLRQIRTDIGDTLHVHCLGDVKSRGPNLDMRKT